MFVSLSTSSPEPECVCFELLHHPFSDDRTQPGDSPSHIITIFVLALHPVLDEEDDAIHTFVDMLVRTGRGEGDHLPTDGSIFVIRCWVLAVVIVVDDLLLVELDRDSRTWAMGVHVCLS